MTYRPFTFFSGEFKVSMPAVFSMDNWQHTSTAERLVVREGKVFRTLRPADALKGCIFLADCENKELEENNYQICVEQNLPCWPDPCVLLNMFDRFELLAECKYNGFVDHDIDFGTINQSLLQYLERGRSLVMKVGNVHRGEGKLFVHNLDVYRALSATHTEYSLEPFFEGTSVRALVVGDDTFGIQVDNQESWIKNTAGADIRKYHLPKDMLDHARKVAQHFGLDLAGVDYIVNKEGFHFLEINYCPGVSGFEDVEQAAKKLFIKKMREVEYAA